MAIFSDRTVSFIAERLQYLTNLKNCTEQQKIFIQLGTKFLNKDQMTALELRALKTLEAAERADKRAATAKQVARKLISEQNELARKERTHNMINSAGLMSLAGLLDKKTGKPKTTNERLLGALYELAVLEPSEEELQRWEQIGSELLAKKAAKP